VNPGPFFILRITDDEEEDAIVVGGGTLISDNSAYRAWVMRELLRVAAVGTTQARINYDIEKHMATDMAVDNTRLEVMVRSGGRTVLYRAVNAAEWLGRDAEDSDDADDDVEEQQQVAEKPTRLREGIAHCDCGHRAGNHEIDDGDVYCKLCESFTDDCQKLIA